MEQNPTIKYMTDARQSTTMKQYTIQIELKSDALIGSGEGFGAIIDSDIVFDNLGIPYIPAKRIKGCLRDSANEVSSMLEDAEIKLFGSLDNIVNDLFGKPGNEKSAPISFSNITIEQYKENYDWLQYLAKEYKFLVSRDAILTSFTALRQQTAIDETTGIAKDHSLRTIRVIKKGLIFKGNISITDEKNEQSDMHEEYNNLLVLSCLNLKKIGTKRNRGFGEVECKLFDHQPRDLTEEVLEVIGRV